MINNQKMVDAIDDGRIVHVSEDYAIREGLPILRRPRIAEAIEHSQGSDRRVVDARLVQPPRQRKSFTLDPYRKPLRSQDSSISSSLIDNFHWAIIAARKKLMLTRKHMAEAIHTSESDLKMLENGVLPSEDYILVNKVEQYLGINLRKDGSSYGSNLNSRVSAQKLVKKEELKVEIIDEAEDLLGSDIDIVEED